MPTMTPREVELLSRLIALAHHAHHNVDLADPADYWYRLGQRNAYAHAAAIAVAPTAARDDHAVAEKITAALSDVVTDLGQLQALALEGMPVRPPRSRGSAALTWVGPKAFAATFGDRAGVDHDFGFRWGQRGDTRVWLRQEPGSPAGLLFAFNATWDEYALLHPNVATDVVEAAFAEAHHTDPRMPAEELAMFVHIQVLALQAQPRCIPAVGIEQ